MTLTFDVLILKLVSESRVTWATSVPILVFLGLSVLDLGPMYATDVRQTSDVRQHHRLMPPRRGHNKLEGCIDDERQFKTAKRSQPPGDATVLKRFFRDNFVICRHRSKGIAFL